MKKIRFLLLTALLALLLCAVALPAFAATAVGTTTLTQGKVTATTAAITWKTKGKADGYLLYRYDFATKSYDRVAQTTKMAYTFKKLSGGESYIFAVRAYVEQDKTVVKGKLSKLKLYTPLAAVTKIKQAQTATTSHQLKWNAVNGADAYQIYYYKDSTKDYALLGTATQTNCTVKKLKPTAVYRYKIRALSYAADGKTRKAKFSDVFSAYTKPDDVTRFTANDVTTTGYRLEWDAVPGADGYRIYRFDEQKGKYVTLTNTIGTSYTVRGLSPCDTAFYRIRAYATLAGVQRFGATTAALSLTTKPEPVEPFLVARPAVNGVIKIGWNAGVCDGYLVYAAETEDGAYQLLGQVDGADQTQYAFRSPFDAEKVFIRVKTYVTVDGNKITSAYSSALEIE